MDSIKQRIKRAGQGLPIRSALVLILFGSAVSFLFSQSQAGFSTTFAYFVRNLAIRLMPDGQIPGPDVNTRGDLMVSQSLPERAELVRLGNSWTVVDTTGVAALTSVPTTVAANTFWNGEPDGGKSYIVDRAFCTITTSTGAASGKSIMGMMNKGPVAAPTGVSLTVSTLNGRSYPGKMVIGRSVTVTNDFWWALPGPANSVNLGAGTVDVGGTMDAPLNGLVVIPPRHQFSLHLLTVATTPVCRFGITWHEVQLPIAY